MNNGTIPSLDDTINLAITFAPNEDECKSLKVPFPFKIKNVTTAKTENGNNVKPQFTVKHVCYKSWELTDDDIVRISLALIKTVQYHMEYVEPLKYESGKVLMWDDTSNCPPREIIPTETQPIKSKKQNHLSPNELIQQWNNTIDKITENKTYKNMKKVQRINESQLRAIVAESVRRVLKESISEDEELRYGANEINQPSLAVQKCAEDIFEYVNGRYPGRTVCRAIRVLMGSREDDFQDIPRERP